MSWFFKFLGLIPWLDEKLEARERTRTGNSHINHLNNRQREVLVALCEEYERTGRPVSKDQVYSEIYPRTFNKYPGAPGFGNEVTEMLDDLESRGFVERSSSTITPNKKLLNHLRRTRII